MKYFKIESVNSRNVATAVQAIGYEMLILAVSLFGSVIGQAALAQPYRP